MFVWIRIIAHMIPMLSILSILASKRGPLIILNITSSSIKLLRKFKNLRELEVNAWNADEDISQTINVLVKTNSITCLEKFKFTGVINKKVFIQFWRKGLKLKSLSIYCSDIFRDIRISNEFLINLKKSKKLKELKLDMKIIKTFDNLKVLVLNLDEEHIYSNDIKRITDLKSLTKLYIYCTNLKPEHISHLISNLKTLNTTSKQKTLASLA